jgi:hypothetical protein
MKLEEALKDAWELEEECLAVIKKENATWRIPESELGNLRQHKEYFERLFSGLFAVSHLQRLIQAGVVEHNGENVLDLEAVPGFKDSSFSLPESARDTSSS